MLPAVMSKAPPVRRAQSRPRAMTAARSSDTRLISRRLSRESSLFGSVREKTAS